MIEFIFMLTHNDRTVDEAPEVLASLKDTGLRYVGFKDVGSTPGRRKELVAAAHELGMEVMLEVVSTSTEAELESLRGAIAVGFDWVLGGTHGQDGAKILAGSGIKYCPFPGAVVGHPSVLEGSIEDIASDTRRLTAMNGVTGVDLLTYRHPTADPAELTRAVVEASTGPVVAAGSVVDGDQIRLLADAGAWGFTIGGAIFEGLLPGGGSVPGQVAAVLEIAENA